MPKDPKLIELDPKRQALMSVVDAVTTLEKRSDQVDVLRAAASFLGLVVPQIPLQEMK